MAEPPTEPGQWLSQSEAAARLGWHLERLKSAARRGKLRRRKGNRDEWLVFVPDEMLTEPPTDADHANDNAGDNAVTWAMAELREELTEALTRAAHAEGRVTAMLERVADLAAALEHERAERAKLAVELAEARKPVLVRLIEALRRR